MKQSSPSVSEDVPLKQKIKTKTKVVVKKAKKEVRKNTVPIQPNAKKFVIPRNKKTRELLDIQGLESRDAIEVLRKVKQSFYQPDNISNYVFENVTIVHNPHFNTEFSAKKQEMRVDGYAQKDLEDTFAYVYLDGWHKVRKMAKEGLCVGSTTFSSFGDPKMGVYLSRFPDVVLPFPVPPRSSKYLMVFKITKGKLKAVGEKHGDGCPLEPTPNYDGHISKSFPLSHNVSLEQAFTSSQYYCYEFSDDGDDLHAKRPRQCCPYAAVQFSVTSSQSYNSSSRNVLTQDSSLRNLPSHESRNVSSRLEKNNNDVIPQIAEKSLVDGRMYENYSKHGRTLWSGVIKNKENIISSADLICYSSDILPITIGGHIDIKSKVSFEKLKALFPSPVFKQLPAISTKCKVFDHGMMYLYCEIRPRDKNNAKLTKLIKFFQHKNLAGVAEFPDSSVIYFIPTTDFSHQLGLTDRHYPIILNALILKRLPKEDIQSYKKMNKMTADPITEAAVRRDIRKELRRIEIEKLKKREQSESSSKASTDMDVSSSDQKDKSNSVKKTTDVKNKADTGVIVEREDNVDVTTKDVVPAEMGEDNGKIVGDNTIDSMQKVQNNTEDPNKACEEPNIFSTSKVSEVVLGEVESSPNEHNEKKIAEYDETFKSPPRIQKQFTGGEDMFTDNVKQTNTITRHYMDPRLSYKTDRTEAASPTEIEPLSSDSGVNTPESSPAVYSKTKEGQPNLALVATDGGLENTVSQVGKTPKDNVSRLSSRLMALFSQSGKSLTKNVETTGFTVTSRSLDTPSKLTPSLPDESKDVTGESSPEANIKNVQTMTPSLNIQSFSASESQSGVRCAASDTEKDKTKVIDLSTCASTRSQIPPLNSGDENLAVSATSQETTIKSSASLLASNTTVTNTDSMTTDSEWSSQPNVTYPSAEALPSISSWSCTASVAVTGSSTSSNVSSASKVSSVFITSSTGTTVFTNCKTSLIESKVEDLCLPDRHTCPSEGEVLMTDSQEYETLSKSEKSPMLTSNKSLNEIISFFRAKSTTKTPVTFLVSPNTRSSPESSHDQDENLSDDIPHENDFPREQTFESIATLGITQGACNMDLCDTMEMQSSCNSKSELSSSSQTASSSHKEYSSSNVIPKETPTTGKVYETDAGCATPSQTAIVTLNETYNETFPPVETKISRTSESCGTVSTPPTVGTPPLPTEALPPPPPPPPLTSSFSIGYVSTLSDSKNRDTLSHQTPTSMGRGVYTACRSYQEDQSKLRVQPSSQECCDLYEYGLTLSSKQSASKDCSDLYVVEGRESSADSSRSSTPVISMHENQLFPRSVGTCVPPPPPQLPPPPPPVIYSTHAFHQENYSQTYSPFYTHPYPGIQPIPVLNPTIPDYQYSAPRSIGYSGYPSPAVNNFDTSVGFGYTKQITPLWNQDCIVDTDENPSLANKDPDLHENSTYVAEMSSQEILDSESKTDKTFSSKLDENERDSFEATKKKLSSFKDDGECNSKSLVLKEKDGEPSCVVGKQDHSESQKDASRSLETSSCVDKDVTCTKENTLTKPKAATTDERVLSEAKTLHSQGDSAQLTNASEDLAEDLTNIVDDKKIMDPLQVNRRDKEDTKLNTYVSNVYEFLNSNDETYEDISLSDTEIPSSKTEKETKRKKTRKKKRRGSASSNESHSIQSFSEHVDSNDETFVEIALSKKAETQNSGVGHRDGRINQNKEIRFGRKREKRTTDLREFIKEKKRKSELHYSEKHVSPRYRQRDVEIIKSQPVASEDSTPERNESPDSNVPSVMSYDLESEVVQDHIRNVVANRRKIMTSPVSERSASTPDHTQELDEMRWKVSSPDRKRRSTSPESETRTRSPDWIGKEHHRLYNTDKRRRDRSSDSSRAGSNADSRPGSSASARRESNIRGLRPGTSASLRSENNLTIRSQRQYPSRKRTRTEKETPDKSYWSGLPLDIDHSTSMPSSRGLDEDCSTKLLSSRMDDNYPKMLPVRLRHERQKSPSETHNSYVSERDSTRPLSPARESRYRSRYSIKRSDARSSSSESGSYRRKRKHRNDNWSRFTARDDEKQPLEAHTDLSEAFLSRLTRPDIIEAMQNHIHNTLQRTINELPGCLDDPVVIEEREEKQPFFGGIGEFIYAKRDEEDSLLAEDRNYRSDLEISRRDEISRPRTLGDYGEDGSAEIESSMDSSLGARAEQNAEQNDVINNICNKDFVNKKKSGMLNALKSSKMPVSTCQNNQTTSHILDKTFIAQFKEKRRRLLLEQLRNMRGKEKIGSCAIILAQLEKLKRDVRKLSAAKLRRTNGASTNNRCGVKSQSKESTKKNEVQSTQNTKQHLDYETIRASVKDIACENTTKTYPRLLWKAVDVSVHDSSMRKNLGESSDYNPMSMETSDSDVPTVNDTSKRHDDIQLPNEICDVFRQDSLNKPDINVEDYNNTKLDMQSLSTLPRLKSSEPKVDETIDDGNKHHKTIHTLSTQISPRNRGRLTTENATIPEKENKVVRSRSQNKEKSRVRNRGHATEGNNTNDNISAQFDGTCGRKIADQLTTTGPRTLPDFDVIAQKAKYEFKLQLMIKSQELFSKKPSDFVSIGRKKHLKTAAGHKIQIEGNNASGRGKVVKPKDKSSHLDLSVSQPSPGASQSRHSEEDLERQLSKVLETLTKSQLHLLQSGSPRVRNT